MSKHMQFELMDRRKGEPINAYFFQQIKSDLARVRWTGLSKSEIARMHNVGVKSVRLVERVPNFLAYTELAAGRPRRKITLPKRPGVLARIFKRK